jgi:hypothetical protein
MYDPMIYADMINFRQRLKQKPEPKKRMRIYAVKCLDEKGTLSYRFCSSQVNSLATTNVAYDFLKRFPNYLLLKIIPTDAFVIL